jgi:hypothetical protein
MAVKSMYLHRRRVVDKCLYVTGNFETSGETTVPSTIAVNLKQKKDR